MNPEMFLFALLRCAIGLAIAAALVGTGLRITRARSPGLRRWAWMFVLLQGVCWAPYSFEIAVLRPDSEITPDFTTGFEPISDSILEPNDFSEPEIENEEIFLPAGVFDVSGISEDAFELHRVQVQGSRLRGNLKGGDFAFPGPAESPGIEEMETPHDAAEVFVQPAGTPPSFSPEPLPIRAWSVPEILFALWIAGISLIAALKTLALFQVVCVLRKSRRPDAETLQFWNEFLQRENIPLKNAPKLWMSEQIGPGLARFPGGAAILMPRPLWEESSEAVRRGILRHELSHHKHGDAIVSVFASLLAMLQWFNPAAWFALHRFHIATECRCDAEAFGKREESLLEFAESMLLLHKTSNRYVGVLQSYKNRSLRERLHTLTEYQTRNGESPMKKTILFLALFLILALGAVRVRLTAQDPSPPQPAPTETLADSQKRPEEETPKNTLSDSVAESETNTPERDEDYIELLQARMRFAEKNFLRLNAFRETGVVLEETFDEAELRLQEARYALIAATKGKTSPAVETGSVKIRDSQNIDPDYIELLQMRTRIASSKFARISEMHAKGLAPDGDYEQAQLELAEAEYALKKALKTLQETESEAEFAKSGDFISSIDYVFFAKRKFDRTSKLFRTNTISQEELDLVALEMLRAEQELEQAIQREIQTQNPDIDGTIHRNRAMEIVNSRTSYLERLLAEVSSREDSESSSETSDAAVDPALIELLKKRVETGKRKVEFTEKRLQSGAAGVASMDLYKAQAELADHEAELYRALGDRKKRIEALESKVEFVKNRLRDATKASEAGTKPADELPDIAQSILEAEYELASVQSEGIREQRSRETADSPPQMDEVNPLPARIELMQMGVQVARKKLEHVEKLVQMGHQQGTATAMYTARADFAEKEAGLYRALNDYENLLEALNRKHEAQIELRRVQQKGFEAGVIHQHEVAVAEQAVLETEYELEQVANRPLPIVPQPPQSPLSWGAPAAREKILTFQGKTFEEWVWELETELDPKDRAEAFHALTLFGANGRGKEAAEKIFEAMKSHTFGPNVQKTELEKGLAIMEEAAVSAFTGSPLRIPFEDSAPLLMHKFLHGNTNEQNFSRMIVSRLPESSADSRFAPLFLDTLKTWNISDPADSRPMILLRSMAGIDYQGESMLHYLEDAIERNDAARFRLAFSEMESFTIEGRVLTAPDLSWSRRGKILGFLPDILSWKVASKSPGGEHKFQDVGLNPYGQSLLKLLQEKGLGSENEEIRKESEKVVNALLSIPNVKKGGE